MPATQMNGKPFVQSKLILDTNLFHLFYQPFSFIYLFIHSFSLTFFKNKARVSSALFFLELKISYPLIAGLSKLGASQIVVRRDK